jgi:hypothetical protein
VELCEDTVASRFLKLEGSNKILEDENASEFKVKIDLQEDEDAGTTGVGK